MSRLLAFAMLCSVACGDGPSIVGPPTEDAANNVIRAKVGDPPFVTVRVKDVGKDDVESWTGPIGEGQVAAYARDGGIVVSTASVGSYPFRCVVQTPTAGLDHIEILDTIVVVEGSAPGPTPVPPGPTPPGPTPPKPPQPPVPPTPTLAEQIAAAVRAHPDASLSGVADGYEVIANRASAGVATISEIQGQDQLASVLSPAWATIRVNVVEPFMKKLTLAKPADYAPVWQQIVAGIRAGLGPQPPPTPPTPNPPTPNPPTPDPPAPIPAQELRVLILYDDTANLTVAQESLINSEPLRMWLDSQNVKWHVWPITVDASMQDKAWQNGIANRSGPGPCWLQVSNGTTGFNGALPATIDEIKATVTKFKN